jgi:hypothetical protein
MTLHSGRRKVTLRLTGVAARSANGHKVVWSTAMTLRGRAMRRHRRRRYDWSVGIGDSGVGRDGHGGGQVAHVNDEAGAIAQKSIPALFDTCWPDNGGAAQSK